jgi:glycerol-3-phosphate dehydrogenase
MSDPRRFRNDDRRRHDGKADHPPAPCISLDPQTLQPMRINVTAQDAATLNESLGSLSFDAQKEAIRRANSILLARTLAAIEAGAKDEATINALAKVSTIAKQWTAEERQSGGDDPSKLSISELRKAAQ